MRDYTIKIGGDKKQSSLTVSQKNNLGGKEMKSKIFIMLLVLCCLLVGFVVVSQGKQSTTITCYAGNPDDNQNLGTVEVFHVANAASTCNSVYADCNGNCTGCYIDEESQEICIDKAGRLYKR